MPLVTLDNVSIAFGVNQLLDCANLTIDAGERICVIGRNGEGKSTLLKIIQGLVNQDSGDVNVQSGIKISALEQDVYTDSSDTVYHEITNGLGTLKKLLYSYHQLVTNPDLSESDLIRLEQIQHELEANDGWNISNRVDSIISKLELDADARLSDLSGGWLRRVYLAKALISEPDLLLLDEPTNHLDIEAIEWLEEFLLDYRGGMLFITHDRSLLKKLATRIVEIDRGRLTSWPGDYENYLRRKDEVANAEELANKRFDKKLSQEETWIRQGIKARRTRNEGRVRSLLTMREEFKQRRSKQGTASFSIEEAEKSGKIVIEAYKIHYAWEDTRIANGLSLKVQRGDRIALIGPNGCGKTTLLRVLLGELQPQQGKVKLGTKLEVAYFDQLRNTLNLEESVIDNVAHGSDYVEIGGSRKHIMGYLSDFLFTPERVRTPVKALSGGERNRLLLARLFSKPANVLVLDEPTNDLDIESLELLEEKLADFSGTIIIVSHDRSFLDNVVTSSLFFEGGGNIGHYVGGYSDAKAAVDNINKFRQEQVKASLTEQVEKPKKERSKTPAKKLSYKDQRELDSLPGLMEELENKIDQLQTETSNPEFYQQDNEIIAQKLSELESAQNEFDDMFMRWEELDSKIN
ncbi:MAG: ATP-binding cassette domain-containing protein [Gammaproteobacteria bacterium]|nr:MAG: ATP-binding cassette domain-containing protein [Gammaproteobacteria bacterium]